MRIIVIFVILLILFGPSLSGRPSAVLSAEGHRVVQAVTEYYGPGAAASKLYLGAEACLSCHPAFGGWRRSLHATGLKTVDHAGYSMQVKDGVIVDYDRNGVDDFVQGLDFNRINSVFNPYKPNAPVLRYENGKGYFIRIGQVDFRVVLTHGGTGQYKQRFLIKYPVTDRPGGLSAGTYYSPIQFNEASKSYVVYEIARFYNSDGTPKINGPMKSSEAASIGKNLDRECSGCHATGLAVGKDALGEFVAQAPPVVYADPNDPHYFDLNNPGMRTSWNIGCESCHGPGSQHVTGLGKADRIINPARLTARQANEICGSCHSRGTSKGTGMYEFPWDEAANAGFAENLGDDLYGKYFADKPGLWPDKKESRQHHQQFQDFMTSAKWEFAFHKVTCFECHDVHSAEPKSLRGEMVVDTTAGGKVAIATKVSDNSLCLACHAGFGPFQSLRREDIADIGRNRDKIGAVVSEHTHHPYDPENRIGLSRCTECHMAKVAASGDAYDISSHTFHVISPQQTLATQKDGGMPNSCAVRCHRLLAPLQGLPADASLSTWTETSDQELARYLQVFYGPDGIWWSTKQ